MTIFQDFLTQYDENLSGDSYIDPVGMLVIWSAFGQRIFNNRVNSISNDVRNYTLNLINHYLVRRLVGDDSVVLSRRLASVYGIKDEPFFKYACLLYLENLFAFSVLKHEGPGVDIGGVLGGWKARLRWEESNHDPVLTFTHDKDGQILVRQLSLGVSGRYKTPLMEIGYFDGKYHYHQPKAAELWARTDTFVAGVPELTRLVELAYAHLKFVLEQSSTKPTLAFSQVPAELVEAFVAAFPSSAAVGRYARDYWLHATGLDQGAAGALLAVLDEQASQALAEQGEQERLSPQDLVALACRKALDEEERLKMEHIQLLEPLLAEATLLFTLLTVKKTQPLAAVINEWRRFGRNDNTLPTVAAPVSERSDLLRVVSGTAHRRLLALLRMAGQATVADQIAALLAYHRDVMAERSQLPWLTVDGAGVVKVNVRPSTPPDPEHWKGSPWVNSYYLPQFQWLVQGYQGRVA